MSKAKLTAARELIQEKQYDAARKILETMNDPTAQNWLAKLDRIAPRVTMPPAPPSTPNYPLPPTMPTYVPPPNYAVSAEQERYYRAENKHRRRRQLGGGIELIFMGIGCWVFAVFLGSLPKYSIPGTPPSSSMSFEAFLIPIGLLLLVGGFIKIKRRG